MFRSLTLSLCLLSMTLTGCPSLPPATETGSEPTLPIVHSEKLLPLSIDFLAFSEDGSTFVVGGESDGVGLYRASDYALLERYYSRDEKDLTWGAGIGKPRASISNVGYIDANTWYFGADVQDDTKNPGELNVRLYIRTLQPAQEIAVLNGWGSLISANKNHILSGEKLIDWHTGKEYLFRTLSFDPHSNFIPALTPDSRVIVNVFKKSTIIDPINNTEEFWKEAAPLGRTILFTPDNRHALGLSTANYKCTLWLWPERKKVGQCSPRLRGIFGSYPDHLEVVALSLDGKFFAIGFDNNVRVYRIEPFKLELEATTPGPVAQLALSDNGLLAAYDYRGFLRIWNIATGSLAGQRSLLDGKLHIAYSPKLAFQPGSGKLFTTYNDLTVFEIPRQAAQQKAESDPGTRKE